MAMALAILDLLCSAVLVKLMTQITDDWNFSDQQGRWAALRRAVYLCVAVALFAKGLNRLEYPDRVEFIDFSSQVVVLIGLMLFPVMRALGYITQDQWRDVNGEVINAPPRPNSRPR